MKTIARALYNKTNDKAYLWAIIAGIPSIYFLLITYFGKDWGITKDQTGLTGKGLWISVPIILIFITIIFLKALGDKYDSEIKRNGMNVMNSIIHKSNDSRISKIGNYSDFISDTNKQSICKHMAPLAQLRTVMLQAISAVNESIGVENSDIYAIIIYRTKSDEKYKLITSENAGILHREPYINDIDKLIIREVINGKRQYVKNIVDNDQSLYSWYKTSGIKSVYCANLTTVLSDTRILEAYSIIGTMVFPICNDEDRDTRTKFKAIIMNAFDLQYKLELLKIIIREDDKCERKNIINDA